MSLQHPVLSHVTESWQRPIETRQPYPVSLGGRVTDFEEGDPTELIFVKWEEEVAEVKRWRGLVSAACRDGCPVIVRVVCVLPRAAKKMLPSRSLFSSLEPL